MDGVRLLEIDELFIPGSSGSPILNSVSDTVIGLVHGFRAWPVPTQNEISHDASISIGAHVQNANLKYKSNLITSLSLGIDLRSVEHILRPLI